MHIVKVGGNELDVPGFAQDLAVQIKNMAEPTVVVHGGGRGVSSLQAKLGIQTTKVDGLRVSDEASLEVATMVLGGLANKRLVAAFQHAGLDAIGLSGVDGGVVRATKKKHPTHDLGYVGQVAEVRTKLLTGMLSRGHTVVLAPISLGIDGHLYNVNADDVAAAVAIACAATALSFVTNVPGVKDGDRLVERITTDEVDGLEKAGVVQGGMVPKLRAARGAAAGGVQRVRIVDLAGLSAGRGTLVLHTRTTTDAPRADATA